MSEETIYKVNNELTTVPDQVSVKTFSDLFAKAQALDDARSIVSITPQYFEFKDEGETRRGVYLGTKTLKKGNGDSIKAIQWLESDGSVFVNGGTALVSALDLPMGTSIEIKYLGKKKTATGYHVNLFDIRILVTEEAPF